MQIGAKSLSFGRKTKLINHFSTQNMFSQFLSVMA